MTARANWFLDEAVALAEEDPFARVDVANVGVPIELGGDTAELGRLYVELLHAEGVLEQRGVTCPIKLDPDATCSACPVRQTSGARAALCRLGCEQERVATTLVFARGNEVPAS